LIFCQGATPRSLVSGSFTRGAAYIWSILPFQFMLAEEIRVYEKDNYLKT